MAEQSDTIVLDLNAESRGLNDALTLPHQSISALRHRSAAMRRDPDLIRELLLKLEAYPMRAGGAVVFEPDYEELATADFSGDEIAYHLDQIRRMGFIDDYGSRPLRGFAFACLTPAGHDFLDTIRTPETWGKTKDAAKKAGGFTIEILKETAKAIVRGELHKLGLTF